MSVMLVTGQTGGGKTALVVDMLANSEDFKGRPLFVMGIPELKLDHCTVPPVSEWTEFRVSPEDDSIHLPYFVFPEGSVIVIDEAQRVFRPRPVGSKVPPEVQAFETHRHTGVDFILLTQHPNLLDSNIRKLINRHIHIRVTALGRYSFEWTECGDPESTTSRQIAARKKYNLPRRSFDLYKSSQLHTKIERSIPLYVWMFGIALLMAAFLAAYGYKRVSDKVDGGQPVETINQAAGKITKPKSDSSSAKTPAQYIASHQPRIAGLAHTAPIYDSITTPTDAPFPVGCMISKGNCRCIDQQGNKYETTYSICIQIVQNGIFRSWSSKEQKQDVAAPPTGQMLPALQAAIRDPEGPIVRDTGSSPE